MDYSFDIAVVGGGLSGVCAAISAARNNKKVVLIQNRPVLGGNSSSEIRVWTRGSTGAGSIYAEEMGVIGELKLRNEHLNPDSNPVLWDEVLLEKVLEEQNITLYLNTHVSDIEFKDDEIKYLIAHQITCENTYRIFSKMFIDASGDGILAYKCNIPFSSYKEAKAEYDEEYAPVNRDYTTLGSTCLFFTKELDHEVKFVAPSFAYSLEKIEEILNNGERELNETNNGCDYWWIEYGGLLDTIKDSQEITLELKKLVFGIWNYIKNSGKFNSKNLTLEWVGNIGSKRESRRFKTEYFLTFNDLVNQTVFEDSALYGGWYCDFHPSEGIYSKEKFCTQIPVCIYEIPLRCLYSKKANNLFLAGRNIGTTHAAYSSTRIMNTCALTGQASGIMSSILIDNNLNNNQIDLNIIKLYQQQAIKEDVFILNVKDEMPNLAKEANITALSIDNYNEEVTSSLVLQCDTYICYPNKLTNHFTLEVKAIEETSIILKYYQSYLPSRLVDGKLLYEEKINIRNGINLIKFKEVNELEIFNKVVVCKNSLVSINLVKNSLTGFIVGPNNGHTMFYPKVNLSNYSLYDKKSLTNGYNRVFKNPNVFISKYKESAEINFDFNEVKSINKVVLYLNPNLTKELLSSRVSKPNQHHNMVMIDEEKIVTDIIVLVDNKEVKRISNNYQRLVQISLDNICTKNLKLLLKTNKVSHVEVFEIRIY